MKYILTALIATFALLAANTTFAYQVGLLDLQEVYEKTTLRNQATDEVYKQQEQFFERIKPAKIQLREDKIKLYQGKITEAEKAALESKIKKEQRDLAEIQDQFRKKLTIIRKKYGGKATKKLFNAVEQVAKKKGLNMVTMKNNVAYIDHVVDVTPEVIVILNKDEANASKNDKAKE